jgi:S-phase kinase-associated protein 1
MSDNDESYVEIVSGDKQKFKVKKKIILMSGLISDMLEEQDEEDEDIPSIPIPNVNGKTFEVIQKYIQHHWNNKADEIKKPLKGKIEDVISQWDNEFLNSVDQTMLIELIMASNYLNIKDLLDLTSASMASGLKGKTPEKIRDMLSIECDFDPEEKRKIKEENKWAE